MFVRLAFAAILVAAPGLRGQTQEIEVTPETVVAITLLWGEARVIGDGGLTVRITEYPERLETDPSVIAATGAPIISRLEGNELEITQDTSGQGRFPASAIEVRVPKASALRVVMLRGGELDVRGLNGDTEIRNHNGSVSLADMAGGIRVTAMNGAITGTLLGVGPSASFASLNGEIDLTLPDGVALTARLRTANGRLRSEFPVEVEERSSTLGDGVEVTATINGGGTPFIATTRSGDITLRRRSTDES